MEDCSIIKNDGDFNTRDLQLIEKETEYYNYIKDHISNVNYAYRSLFYIKLNDPSFILPGTTKEFTNKIINHLDLCINTHDMSKYGEYEFYPYRRYFYPTDKEKILDNSNEDIFFVTNTFFNAAWKHHYTHNDHHPLFWRWVNITSSDEFGEAETYKINNSIGAAINMPLIAICHMICDWSAMSIKYSKDLSPVYWWHEKAQSERLAMSPDTLKTTNDILSLLFPNNADIKYPQLDK